MARVNYRRQRNQFVRQQRLASIAAAKAQRELMTRDHYGPPCVMRSAAGFYVGCYFWDSEYQFYCPADRFTGYYATREEAEFVLPVYTDLVA